MLKITKPFCTLPWEKIFVDMDGHVQVCCLEDYNPGSYNILEKSFEEVWKSQRMQDMRQSILAGRVPDVCKNNSCKYLSNNQAVPCVSNIDVPKYPSILELFLPDGWCNIGNIKPCFMCGLNHVNPRDVNVFWKVVERIREYVPHLKHFLPIGQAEVFWRNQLWLVLEKLGYDNHKNHITLGITSNGTVFDKKIQDKFLNTAPSSILTISLDSASPETYKTIRRLDCYDVVVKNVLSYANNPKRSNKQRVGVGYNINLKNVHETEKMVAMWKGTPVNVVFSSTLPWGGEETIPYLVNKDNWQVFRKAKLLAIEAARKNNVHLSFFTEIDGEFAALP